MSEPLTCGEALMGLLADYGVDTVFGMPGTHTVELYRGIARSEIRHVQCRNEQGAGLMADGYARATGKPGVCTIVTGPGVTNASTAIAQAYCDSVPMLVLSGACHTQTLGKGWGTTHELDDQSAVTASFTAMSAMVHHPDELPELVARAFAIFNSSRPRPVHLSLPWNVLPELVHGAWTVRRSPSRPMPDPAAIEEAAELLAKATTPLIVVGGGAAGSGDSLAAIAERIGAPVLATNAGKGILAESHSLSLGCSILQEPSQAALAEADTVLVVGTEIAEGDHFLPKLEINGEIVRIDIDPTELTSMYGAAVAIQSAAVAAMSALAAALADREVVGDRAAGEQRVGAIAARNNAGFSADEQQHQRVWKALRAAMPANTIVMADVTQLVYTGCFALPVEFEKCWYYPGTYCALGVAMPMAIGAKVGAPDRPVIAVCGDGGFMFTVGEMVAAVEEKLPIPIIVWNNDALKEIVDQMDRRQMPRVGVEPRNPNFIALAESFGCHGVRAESAEHLREVVRGAFQGDRPTLIEVCQDSPWLLE